MSEKLREFLTKTPTQKEEIIAASLNKKGAITDSLI